MTDVSTGVPWGDELGASLLEAAGHEVLRAPLSEGHAEALDADIALGLVSALPMCDSERLQAESALRAQDDARTCGWGTGTEVAFMTELLSQSSSSLAQEAVDTVASHRRSTSGVQRRSAPTNKGKRRAAADAPASPAGGERTQRRVVLAKAPAKRQRA